jgi:signal transduction histidine kinase
MNKDLQSILNIIQQSAHVTDEEKDTLSKAAKSVNKELEIESSLERVRTIAMSMNKPDDMLHVCHTISDQLELLNLKEIRNVQTAIFYKEKGTYMNYEYYAKHDKTFITETSYTNHEIHQDFADKMLKGNGEFMVAHIKGDEVKDWIAYQKTTNVFIDDYLNTASSLNYYWFSLGAVALGISTYSPLNEEETNLFKRFLKVFELSYRRYLDIEKAEAQARESQIQLALERVRARTMAMQKSDELAETASLLFKQLLALGIKSTQMRTCAITTLKPDEPIGECWITKPDGDIIPQSFMVPYNETSAYKTIYAAWKNGEKFLVVNLSGDALVQHLNFLKQYAKIPTQQFQALPDQPTETFTHAMFFSQGYLFIISNEPLPEYHDIFKRFGAIFQQTYTRFLDLQKAESQAKESQIQLALERVRARTMAMQKSDELSETVFILFQQFKELGENPDQATIGIINEEEWVIEYWVTMYGNQSNRVYKFPIDEPNVTNRIYNGWKEQKKSLVIELSGKELYDFAHFREILGGAAYNKKEKKRVINVAFFSKGIINVQSNESRSADSILLLESFAKVFEQTYTRFLDLQKAEAQVREAQIEAALEKIRSRSLAMHKSDELKEAGELLWNELGKLGIESLSSGYVLMDKEEKIGWTYAPNPATGKIAEPLGGLHTETKEMLKVLSSWKKQEPLSIVEMNEEETIAHQTFVAERALKLDGTISHWITAEQLIALSPKRLFLHNFNFKQGYLMIVGGNHLTEKEVELMLRFTKVFQQTYTRFLDLQKAEAQTIEAQIETALEKVRSCSLAMHKTDELQEVVTVVFEKLKELGVGLNAAGAIIVTFTEGSKDVIHWLAAPDFSLSIRNEVPYFEHSINTDIWQSVENGEDFFTRNYQFAETYSFHKHLFEHTDYKLFPDEVKNWVLSSQSYTITGAIKKNSAIVLYSFNNIPPSEKEIETLKRFSKVFEQAYVRFLDLKKAEAQARESQIEAALERVRSRSMGMQKSDELKEVIKIVYDQFIYLNINIDHAGFVVDHKLKSDWHFWIADKNDIPSKITTPYFDSAWGNDFNNAKEKGLDFFATNLNFEEKNKFYNELLSYVTGLPEESKKFYLSCPGLAGSTVLFEDVSLYIENFSGISYSDEENKILLRFGKVFQQTYTRFNDLQNAEAQRSEAIKRASVDRVRAEIASMRTTTDLEKITPLIWNELTVLAIPFIRCGVFIMDEEQQQVQTFLYMEGKAITSFTSTFSNSKIITEALPYWRRKKIYKTHWDEAAFLEQAKSLVEQGAVTTGEKYLTEHRPTDLYLHFLPFLQGMLYVGDAAPLSEEHLQLVQALADAFSTAYARYEDFNKLEAAKQQVDKTLVDLKQTQTQLIQSEKMASLGELTAGIAHEIQNPLNFVNNFSEVSNELIEELQKERNKAEDSRDEQMENEILNDIKQNLKKINHHGKRADAIVKGMLQHSRSSAGEKEPTDINVLADEYLRLSFQGLRAKDKSFNSAIKTDLDNSIGKINIVPPDIGRVLLNLYNNAFYAVNERRKAEGLGYEPTVTISTRSIQPPSGGRAVEIKVIDNGGGIPQKVIEKIFQPFFTTKPTGQGTGLGLSLSYDIVKAHGGEIQVETKEGEGTKFIIQLPTA